MNMPDEKVMPRHVLWEKVSQLQLERQRLREALRSAAEESWEIKNGLMEIRDSAELGPAKEEWIAAKLVQWGASPDSEREI